MKRLAAVMTVMTVMTCTAAAQQETIVPKTVKTIEVSHYKMWPDAPPDRSPIPPPQAGVGNAVPPSWTRPGSVPPPKTVVIKYGQGGRVDEHISQFAIYRNTGANVEVRGPCYSACTMLTTYIEREKLCIAPGAFMAFHAVRGMERRQYMAADTQLYYSNLPQHIRDWIDGNGGWQALPLDGFWTMYDRELWAMGYPRCAP